RAAHSEDRSAFRGAIRNALESGVNEWTLREKMAEVGRDHLFHRRWAAFHKRRKRIEGFLQELRDEWNELPPIKADEETVAILTVFPDILTKTEQVLARISMPWTPKRQGGRAPIPFEKRAVVNIMSLGIVEDDARAIVRGLGIRTGRPRADR